MVTRWGAGRSGVRIPAGQENFLLPNVSGLGQKPTHLHVQCVLVVFAGARVARAWVWPVRHLRLVWRLTIGWVTPIYRYVPLCCEQVQLHLFSSKRNRKSLFYKVVSCNIMQVIGILGTAVAQLLRYCATNRKVAGSIPADIIGFFRWHNPSDRTMALGSNQPLTEMSTRRISWG
jgi:hypothetical protein